MVTPAVLPNALSTGTGVVATGIQIPASVAAGMLFFKYFFYIMCCVCFSK